MAWGKFKQQEDIIFAYMCLKVEATTLSFVTGMIEDIKCRISGADEDFYIIIFLHGHKLMYQLVDDKDAFILEVNNIEFYGQQTALTVQSGDIIEELQNKSEADIILELTEDVLQHFKLMPIPNYEWVMAYTYLLN